MLTGLDQKTWSGTGTCTIPVVDSVTTGEEAAPKPTVVFTQNVVSP